jgi:N-acyl-D-aspartate/D-glutamate deacylase
MRQNDAMSEHDLVIRNATLVDGTGAPARRADVAVSGDLITAVETRIDGSGRREIDADGLVVTPGFVDIHTHFDGQATWDPILAPSSIHGVTSIVMGNCGVGFAPALPTQEQHDYLINMLEGVEDIPGTALAEGLTWDWETFPQYLDALGRRSYSIDVATQVAHAPLRAYVMGERGADPNEMPTATELAAMADAVRDGIVAGALGFTTSRTYVHRTKDGAPLGTRFSSADELLALVQAMADTGRGVVQLISDAYLSTDSDFASTEMKLMASLASTTGRPLSMTVQQPQELPDRWREMGAWVDGEVGRGAPLKTQVAVRPIGILQGLTATAHPLMICPSFQEIMFRPLPEIVRALQEPERRSRLLVEHAEAVAKLDGLALDIFGSFDKIFPMENPVNYEPKASDSIAARARAAGRPVVEFLIDLLCEDEGNRLLYKPLFNFSYGNLDDVREMLLRDNAVLGLSDAGAHCGAICDGSMSTTALALWTRDRHEEGRLPIELMVHHLTQRTARHVGWLDRGVVAPGYLADLNVIDMKTLSAPPPRIVHDLPAGGRRLMQTATGYVHTIKRGVVTFTDGQHSGDLPGRLVRGAQPSPR